MVLNTPPNDQRNFVHGRIKRAIGGFVKSGFNPLGAAAGFLSPGPATVTSRKSVGSRFSRAAKRVAASRRALTMTKQNGAVFRAEPAPPMIAPIVRRPVSRSLTARPSEVSAAEKQAGRVAKLATNTRSLVPNIPSFLPCIPPWRTDPDTGECKIFIGDQVGPDDTPIGETVMGRYGAGEMPGNMVVNRAICRPGMVLGDDGVCYNRTQISNKQREWPRGRRPLLTGGDMRAISTAARAGKRLEGATKRLQKIGLMKKPAPRRSAAAIHHAK